MATTKKPSVELLREAAHEILKEKTAAQKKIAEFAEKAVRDAFTRAGGRCQCKACGCDHDGQCGKTFKWDERGNDDHNWQAHHMQGQAAGGSDGTMNCKILSRDGG